MHLIASMLFPSIKNLNNLATIEEKNKAIETLNAMIDNIDIDSNQTSHTITDNLNLDFCIDGFTDTQQNSQNQESNELKNYLNSNDLYKYKFITDFWYENRLKYPRLYIISNRLSSIPATNLSSERNFNYSGLTLTDKRSVD